MILIADSGVAGGDRGTPTSVIFCMQICAIKLVKFIPVLYAFSGLSKCAFAAGALPEASVEGASSALPGPLAGGEGAHCPLLKNSAPALDLRP